jgi:hypothetical protein
VRFLSNQRRTKLMADLTALTMPATMATTAASVADDVALVDHHMADTARDSIRRSVEIAKTSSEEIDLLNQLAVFLRCDLLVMEAYKAEAAERGLDRSFPSWVVEATAKWRLQ